MDRTLQTGSRSDDESMALAILDEMDYPMLLLTQGLVVRLANRWALALLRAPAALQLQPGQQSLQIDNDDEHRAVSAALADAVQRGLRRVLTLRGLGAVAVVPMPMADAQAGALMIFAKPSVCQALSIDGFARENALTPGETEVLRGLCAGESPKRIADRRGVALSTVRSQIGALRAKTDTKDLRALLGQVARLPPLVPRVGLVLVLA